MTKPYCECPMSYKWECEFCKPLNELAKALADVSLAFERCPCCPQLMAYDSSMGRPLACTNCILAADDLAPF